MIRIKIIVPQKKGEEWHWSVGGTVKRFRRNANTLLQSIERALVVATIREKTCVYVKYGHGYHNESVPSQNVLEQLWVLSCFLEDYVSPITLKKYEDKYYDKK